MPVQSCGATRAHPGLSAQVAAIYLCFLCSCMGSESLGVLEESLVSWTPQPRDTTQVTSQEDCCQGWTYSNFFRTGADDTLAERSRRRPAKSMGCPRVGLNATGVACPMTWRSHPRHAPNGSPGKCVSPHQTPYSLFLQNTCNMTLKPMTALMGLFWRFLRERWTNTCQRHLGSLRAQAIQH